MLWTHLSLCIVILCCDSSEWQMTVYWCYEPTSVCVLWFSAVTAVSDRWQFTDVMNSPQSVYRDSLLWYQWVTDDSLLMLWTHLSLGIVILCCDSSEWQMTVYWCYKLTSVCVLWFSAVTAVSDRWQFTDVINSPQSVYCDSLLWQQWVTDDGHSFKKSGITPLMQTAQHALEMTWGVQQM